KVSAAAAAAASAGLGRATCSSTMKEAKFPDALDLAPGATDAEGPAATRVCPYTYCSLNGHAHSPAVPLRSFLASRRRLIKTQQSMKLRGVSAFRKGAAHQRPEDTNGAGGGARVAPPPPLIDEEALGDFFVEVYAGPRVSTDMSCSDMSLDEMDAT
ncbi:Os05g0381600, partial [Oryza sativa Japonica Group]